MTITEKLFEELTKEIIRNIKEDNNIPKKYHKKYYKNFLDYLEFKKITKVFSKKNFKPFLICFFDYYYEKNRVDFNQKQKNIIAEKSGYCCAMPHCRTYTKMHDTTDIQKGSGFGQAAHIYSASIKNKTRPPIGIDIKFIESESNGMWLCSNCHVYADYSALEFMYDTQIMFAYKKNIEDEVLLFLNKKEKKYNDLTIKEKDELQNQLMEGKKHSGDFTKIDLDTAKIITVTNAINQVTITFDKKDIYHLKNLEKIDIDVKNINFHNIDKLVKEIYPSKFKLQAYEYRHFFIKFKNNVNLSFHLKNCILIRENFKAIATGFLFDDKNLFSNLFIFKYIYDYIAESISVSITIDIDKLISVDKNIQDFPSFNLLLSLIEGIENDQIEIRVKINNNEGFKIINDYQKTVANFNSFKKYITFLNIIERISVDEGVDIKVNQDLFDKNLLFINSLEFLSEIFIKNDMPNEIFLHDDLLINEKIEVLYEKKKMNFNINLICDEFEISITFRYFDYIQEEFMHILRKNEYSDYIIERFPI